MFNKSLEFKKGWFFSVILIFNIIILFYAGFVFAQTPVQSSGYILNNGQVNPATNRVISSGYILEAGGQEISGTTSGSGYKLQAGSRFSEPVASTNSDSSSGSGSGSSCIGDQPPRVIDLETAEISNTLMLVAFDTNELTSTGIEYWVTGDEDNKIRMNIPDGDDFSFRHFFLLDGVESGVRYEYRIYLRDFACNSVQNEVLDFIINRQERVLPPPYNFEAILGENGVALTWDNPDVDFLSDLVLKRSTNIITNPNDIDGSVISIDLMQNYFDDNIEMIPGMVYYYSLFARGDEGEISSSVLTFIIVPGGEDIIDDSDDEQEDTTIEESGDEQVEDATEVAEYIEAKVVPISEEYTEIPEDVTVEKESFLDGIDILLITKQLEDIRWGKASQVSSDIRKAIFSVFNGKEEILTVIDKGTGKIDPKKFNKLPMKDQMQIGQLIQDLSSPIGQVLPTTRGVEIDLTDRMEVGHGTTEWNVLANNDVLISFGQSLFKKDVKTIIATIGQRSYIAKYNEGDKSWDILVRAPDIKGDYEVVFQIIYDDNSYEEVIHSVLVDPYGFVYYRSWHPFDGPGLSSLFRFKNERVKNVQVTLYHEDRFGKWNVWPAHFYNQYNPQLTDESGAFAFFTPAGKYYLSARVKGFKNYDGYPFRVGKDIVSINIKLHKNCPHCWLWVLLLCVIIIRIFWTFFNRRRMYCIVDGLTDFKKNVKY